MRDLETAISRRDTIVTRSEIAQKNPNIVTQGKIQRDIAEIQKKIKQTTQVSCAGQAPATVQRKLSQHLCCFQGDKQVG